MAAARAGIEAADERDDDDDEQEEQRVAGEAWCAARSAAQAQA